ncbi:hypothetical protein E2562_010506, partial [Oryza meyeriana var. granulata]
MEKPEATKTKTCHPGLASRGIVRLHYHTVVFDILHNKGHSSTTGKTLKSEVGKRGYQDYRIG